MGRIMLAHVMAHESFDDADVAAVDPLTYVLPDASQFERCWPVLRRHFGEIRPAAMMISAGLADPRMRIEIEVTALKPAA